MPSGDYCLENITPGPPKVEGKGGSKAEAPITAHPQSSFAATGITEIWSLLVVLAAYLVCFEQKANRREEVRSRTLHTAFN